jgi:PhnB protein
MASDVPDAIGQRSPHGSISLSGDDADTLRGWFEALAQGGEVTMPLEQAPWGDSFGTVTDKYGVGWLVNIAG